MLTQAKLDQLLLDFRALRRKSPRTTVFDLIGNGFPVLLAPLPFFIDTRREHGLGDLVLSALLRGIRRETEPPPRNVLELHHEAGLLRIETRDTLLWVAVAETQPEGIPSPDPSKHYNAAILLGAAEASTPFIALPYATFLDSLRRFLPAYIINADAHWWQIFVDWTTALAHVIGAEAMKDLNEALKFYDRNREKIESLLQFHRELNEESAAFATRLEAKLRAAGFGDGLSVSQGNCLSLTRTVRLGGHSYELDLDVRVLLDELVLRTEPTVRRDIATHRRPTAEESRTLLSQSGLDVLAGDRRINPDNPEALAYQALRALFQSATEILAKHA